MQNAKKPVIMLHYSGYGTERSPNTQFDLLRNNKILADNYVFITLDQPGEPRKHGHLRTIIDLTRKIKEIKPYAVHIIGVKEGFHCTVAAWLAGCPRRILVTHGFAGVSQKNSQLRRILFQWIVEPITLLLSTKVQCNSKFSYHQKIIRRFARNKSCVVYNFLTVTENMLSYDFSWRHEHHIADNDFLVITIGNMHLGKGYDILTKVIAATAHNSKIKFVVVGDGTLRKEFEEQNQDSIRAEKLICTGAIPHLETMRILSQSNLFYLPTRFETLGMVFAEAGFCSKPSIGTDVGAVGEIIKDGVTGYLVPQDDSQKALEFITALSVDSAMCEKMGQEAKCHISTMFSEDRINSEICALYNG